MTDAERDKKLLIGEMVMNAVTRRRVTPATGVIAANEIYEATLIASQIVAALEHADELLTTQANEIAGIHTRWVNW